MTDVIANLKDSLTEISSRLETEYNIENKDALTVTLKYDKDSKIITKLEFNMLGKCIYSLDMDGVEKWYDNKGNLIHVKYNEDEEYWRTFNDNGNLIHYRDNHGYQQWCVYDENNKFVSFRDSYS